MKLILSYEMNTSESEVQTKQWQLLERLVDDPESDTLERELEFVREVERREGLGTRG